MEKRSIRPETRKAARAEAIKAGKAKKAEAESKKKSEKAKLAASTSRGQGGAKVSKAGAKGFTPKVMARTK